jgi:hypothetical protein
VSNPRAGQSCTITLGQGLNEREAASSPMVGSPAPSFRGWTIDGEEFEWKPVAANDRLLVLCPLWHPESRALIQKARAWAGEHKTEIELVSLDWCLDQAQRELKSLDFTGRCYYAGPGSLKLGESWPLAFGSSALHIKSDGTIAGLPLQTP